MSVSLLASTPGNAEASQIIGTINSVINAINTQILGVPPGSGALSLAIFLPANSTSVNLFSIASATSGSPVILTVGGSSADANQDIELLAIGTGRVLLGGSSLTAPLLVLNGTASVADQILITGGSSGQSLVTIATQGSDTNVDLAISPKGSGVLRFNSVNAFTANSNVAISITALGPAALISSTVSKWLTVKDSGGGLFYAMLFH